MKLDKVVLVRLALASVIVFPPVALWQRSETRADRMDEAVRALAEERVDRTLDSCNAYNDQRDAQIATSEALIRAAAESPPGMLTDQGRLLLVAFVQQANRKLEAESRPKTCTLASLHLEALARVADLAAP